MTNITDDCTFRRATVGELTFLSIVTPSTAATGDTIDLDSDVSDGRGMKMKEILNTYLQDDEGTNVADCEFAPATGIITLPSISTGIHNILVIGK
jgi:hypothetical protein